MDTKDKTIKDIERKILDELGEEIRELRRQGKLYKFETAILRLYRILSHYYTLIQIEI